MARRNVDTDVISSLRRLPIELRITRKTVIKGVRLVGMSVVILSPPNNGWQNGSM
jgi:hypothetical protein